VAVVDLGYGDCGKGAVVDRLCATGQFPTVIRFNGGAQAAHNVVLDDGTHHTFAQFGSGTFTPGTGTHLSRFMMVDPLALATEADHLRRVGVPSPLSLLTVHRDALLTTPFHIAANRRRESARGAARHGSCGMGIGETASFALDHPDLAPRAGDHGAVLLRKLTYVRDRLQEELGPLDCPPVQDIADVYRAFGEAVGIVDEKYVQNLLRAGPCVFEGAQGVLLDETHGFHPHTTWSTTTFANAEELAGGPVRRIGVLRTYTTRHGAGPHPTEDPTWDLPEAHNHTGPWQGRFRTGPFDAVAHRYAADVCGGVDEVALTHLDAPVDVAVTSYDAPRVKVTDWVGFVTEAINAPVTMRGHGAHRGAGVTDSGSRITVR
jgi:adenylosuccinate synthase